MKTDMTLFENHQIRRVYDDESETWWFSVVDIIQVLTQQPDYQAGRNYWKVLKNRLVKEGSRLQIVSAAKSGGGIAKRAGKELESNTGRKVVSDSYYLPPTRNEALAKPSVAKKKTKS